jgi:thiosulfate/3-mercaptopyruvate sulfurtransferase
VHVDHDEWAKGFKPDPPAAEWGKRIGGIGIDGRRPVVVYDDESGKSAARIWWLLRYWGVEDSRLLNGFWHGWKAGGHPIDSNVTKPAPVRFQANAQKDRLATKRELEAAVATGKDKLQILDARSQPEFTGLLKLTNRRGGHVPGARHLEWSVFLDPKTQRFKPAPEIEQMLVSAGITAEGRCVTYCQSGGRASVAAFVLELMGRRDTANYYESWNDWGNDPATPVEKAR